MLHDMTCDMRWQWRATWGMQHACVRCVSKIIVFLNFSVSLSPPSSGKCSHHRIINDQWIMSSESWVMIELRLETVLVPKCCKIASPTHSVNSRELRLENALGSSPADASGCGFVWDLTNSITFSCWKSDGRRELLPCLLRGHRLWHTAKQRFSFSKFNVVTVGVLISCY